MTKGASAIGIVLLLGLVGVVAVMEQRPPRFDQAQAQAVLPVIDEALTKAQKPGALDRRDDLRPQWFCAEDVIEIRPDNGNLKVGFWAHCDELGSNGSSLQEGSGWSGALVFTLTQAPHRIVHTDEAPDGAGNSVWIKRNFSTAGAAIALERPTKPSNLRERTTAEARQAFGLPR